MQCEILTKRLQFERTILTARLFFLLKHSLPLDRHTNNVAKAILHLFYRPEQGLKVCFSEVRCLPCEYCIEFKEYHCFSVFDLKSVFSSSIIHSNKTCTIFSFQVGVIIFYFLFQVGLSCPTHL